jgi:hypothetical protein
MPENPLEKSGDFSRNFFFGGEISWLENRKDTYFSHFGKNKKNSQWAKFSHKRKHWAEVTTIDPKDSLARLGEKFDASSNFELL